MSDVADEVRTPATKAHAHMHAMPVTAAREERCMQRCRLLIIGSHARADISASHDASGLLRRVLDMRLLPFLLQGF
jgi:hypothetical protein